MMNPSLPDLAGEHQAEPVPPEPHGFMTIIDCTLEQNIFYLPKRQRSVDVNHNHEADRLGRAVEIPQRIAA